MSSKVTWSTTSTIRPCFPSCLPTQALSPATVEVPQSRALAGEVVDNLKLVDDEEFNGEKNDLINAALRLVRSLGMPSV